MGVIGIYIPPSIEKKPILNEVQKVLDRWSNLTQMWIIGGDLNARIGEVTDTIFCQTFENLVNKRISKDKVLNTGGRALLEFIDNNQLIILNGRMRGDTPAEITFVSPSGKSIVDYIICSEEMINCCNYLKVLENDIADHFPIQLELTIYEKITKKKLYFSKISKKLSEANDSRVFWKIINSFRKRKLGLEKQTKVEYNIWLKYYNKFSENYQKNVCKKYIGTKTRPEIQQDEIIKIEEVQDCIKNLKDKSTPGSDIIPNSIIKMLPIEIIRYLTRQFNQFYSNSIIPEKWNEVIFTMIFKQGNKQEPTNYRPIALLSCLRKVFTGVLADKFNYWTAANNYRNNTQFAFVEEGGTQTAIFVLLSLIQIQLLKKRHKVFALFLDLEKAYDMISITDLQSKMKR
ncbi:uncharacterized protein LOC111626658 [Centruroides sculpturatus]|uniref:uncharacterized protein LOC111626658 n=1 Tax=Centruroides sculpturatus TaxID=218467 RepID=UPI000C6EC21A|nr:uncharacterized protein LOC111626658 [Centruroides sculpturatus]